MPWPTSVVLSALRAMLLCTHDALADESMQVTRTAAGTNRLIASPIVVDALRSVAGRFWAGEEDSGVLCYCATVGIQLVDPSTTSVILLPVIGSDNRTRSHSQRNRGYRLRPREDVW